MGKESKAKVISFSGEEVSGAVKLGFKGETAKAETKSGKKDKK